VDDDGSVVVAYTYDTWGKLVSITGSAATTLGVANPYRYRSYRYDNETGFYYLNSRYYDPEVGRFINADQAAVSCFTPMGLTDKNLFAYCDNNPPARKDADGEIWQVIAIGAATGFVGGAVGRLISNHLEGKSLVDGLLSAAVGGAMFGGMIAAGVVLAYAAPAAAIVEVTGREISSCIHFNIAKAEWEYSSFNTVKWANDATVGTISYLVGGSLVGFMSLEAGAAIGANFIGENLGRAIVGAELGAAGGYAASRMYSYGSSYIHSVSSSTRLWLNHPGLSPSLV